MLDSFHSFFVNYFADYHALTWIFRSLGAAKTILGGRKATEAILHGSDDRLIVVVGYVMPFFVYGASVSKKFSVRPCSVHDVDAALEYAQNLKAYADTAKDDLHIIMRVYFEKPRTTRRIERSHQ